MFPGPLKIPLVNADCTLDTHYLPTTKADQLLTQLLDQTQWTRPTLRLFDKQVLSPRLAAWYGDIEAIYTYSGLTNTPIPWTPTLTRIRKEIERDSGSKFNSVLLNLYRDGNDAMGWHADDEAELGNCPVIASLSLGACRRFLLRPKKSQAAEKRHSVPLDLSHGSLLLMQGETQKYWQHSVGRTRKTIGPRVNLTFRNIRHSLC